MDILVVEASLNAYNLFAVFNIFSFVCNDYSLFTIKPHGFGEQYELLAQATTSPKITFDNYELELIDKFTYLGSKIGSKLSTDR